MAFFRVLLAARHRGNAIIVTLESTANDLQELLERVIESATDGVANPLLTGREWRRGRTRWLVAPAAIPLSQIAKINEVGRPASEADAMLDDGEDAP